MVKSRSLYLFPCVRDTTRSRVRLSEKVRRKGTRHVTGHETSRALRIVRPASEETRRTRRIGQMVSKVFDLDHERSGSSHCGYSGGTTHPRTRFTSTVKNLGGSLTHSVVTTTIKTGVDTV